MERLVETRHVSSVEYRGVTAGGQQQFEDPNRWLFLPQVSGGSISLPSRSGSDDSIQLYWHLHNHTVSTLSLAEHSLTNGQLGKGVQLQIPGQVFSAVAHHITADACYIFLLLSNKSVGVLRLALPQHAQQGHNQQQQQRSILDTIEPRSLQQVSISQHLAAVGVPTAVTVADGYLCISGSEGGVACLPLAALTNGQQPQQGTVLQLNPSNLISQVRRRMGFAATSSIVAALSVQIPAAAGSSPAGSLQHQSLLVVHDDTSCHQWFVSQGRQGFSQTLVSDAAARQLRPNKVLLCSNTTAAATASSRQPPWDVLLVWDMVVADSSGQSDIRIMPFKLQTAPAGPAAARLESQLQQAQQLAIEWPDASVVDAQIVGQQLLLLCRRAAGGSFIVSYSCRDWSYQGRSQLLQQKVSADWGMTEELWSCALAAFPGAISPAEHVLGKLLVPGQLCMSSLRQALAYHGSQLTEREAATATLAQLKTRMTAAVELIRSKYPSYTPARCWHMLFASYCEFWQQQHALLALYSSISSSSSQGGWLGAVRSGGHLTLLRRPGPAEILLTDSSPGALDYVLQVVGSQGTSGIPGGAAALAKVRLCLSAVSDILGQPAMRVMTQLVMAGVPVQGQLLPKFTELLLQGPSSAAAAVDDTAADLSASRQQRLSEWRMHRQSRLLFIHEQLAELPHALETLSGVAELTIKTAIAAASQLPATPPAAAVTETAPGPQLSTLLCTVALHATRAACMALQQQLLLLGCLSQLGCVGITPLTAADQAAIHSDLIPPLTSALRSAAVALWLCKTPASRPVAGTGVGFGSSMNPPALGPLFGLKGPSPSGTPASTPRGTGDTAPAAAGSLAAPAGPAAAAYWHYPLAAHLLPMFWKQQGSAADQLGKRVGSLGQQLAVWLMLGGSTGATAAAGSSDTPAAAPSMSSAYTAVTSSQDLAGRAVMIGYQLFVCREYEAMKKLVQLIGGDDPAEAGLQFILGLSIACGIRKGSAAGNGASLSPEQRAMLLDSAVGHLFRAAAGLCAENAAPLRLVLQLLRQRQGSNTAAAANGIRQLHIADAIAGAMDMDGVHNEQQSADEAALGEAKVRLEYCQAVMLLFEREGVTEGALAFARAALGAVDAAYSPEEQQAKQEQQAFLWTSVFNSALDLGLNHDAYTAAISNPQPDLSVDSIKRMVYALVERGELAQLLALPWAGVVQLEKRGIREPVPVVQLVIGMLERRALHSPLTAQPSAHHVLFDFLVAWGNYKHAAAAMLGYARRLRAAAAGGRIAHMTVEDVVHEISAAYGGCVAMLQLLVPADAWLDPDQPLLASHPASPPHTNSKQEQHSRNNGVSSFAGAASEISVVTLEVVRQEFELFAASALLLDQLPGLEIMRYDLAADYIVEQLLGAQQFAAAVRLIHVRWEGQQQRLDGKLETVAFELASSCVRLQTGQDAETAGANNSSELEQTIVSYTGPGYLDSAAAAAWHKLRQMLELYDSYSPSSSDTAARSTSSSSSSRSVSSLGGRLRLAAVDGALSVQAGLQLPAWLLQPFRPVAGTPGGMAGSGPDPAALLRTLIKHGRLIDAAELLKDHLEAWQTQSPLLRVQPCAVWLPLHDMELLHASLVAGMKRAGAGGRVHEAELLGVWGEIIERGLADHLALVRSDGDKLGPAAPASNGAIGMVF